jgi:hypothetical protein
MQIHVNTTYSISEENMNLVFEYNRSCRSSGKLYLGNIYAANSKNYLEAHGVKAVLSVLDEGTVDLLPKVSRLVRYLIIKKKRIIAEDDDDFQLQNYFEQANNYIND